MGTSYNTSLRLGFKIPDDKLLALLDALRSKKLAAEPDYSYEPQNDDYSCGEDDKYALSQGEFEELEHLICEAFVDHKLTRRFDVIMETGGDEEMESTGVAVALFNSITKLDLELQMSGCALMVLPDLQEVAERVLEDKKVSAGFRKLKTILSEGIDDQADPHWMLLNNVG